MELPLKFETISCCRLLFDGTIAREELSETIVPDACPDVQRVLETECQAFLRRLEPAAGRVDLSGTIAVQVLYQPEGGGSLIPLTCTIPFQCMEEVQGVTDGCVVQGEVRISSGEARLLNPRKLLLRMELLFTLIVLEAGEETYCGEVLERERWCTEQRIQNETGRWIRCAPCKPATFSEQVTLPGNKPEARQILKQRGWTSSTESKVVGSKLVVKGSVHLEFLCLDREDGVFPAEFELPFSQILDVSYVGEGATAQVRVPITGLETLLSENGRGIDLAVDLLVQGIVWEEQTADFVQDCYSTRYPVTLESETLQILRRQDSGTRRQMLRELLETGGEWSVLQDFWATLGTVSQVQEGDARTVTAQISLHALGWQRDGSPLSVSRSYPVSVSVEVPPAAEVHLHCHLEDLHGEAAAGGIQLQVVLVVDYEVQTTQPVKTVRRLTLDENQPRDSAAEPSVVLRRVGRGEGLWEIAKTYSTTCQDICEANELEEESLTTGQFLLIPKRR